MLERLCLCAEVPTVPTSLDIVILRHQRERHRGSNSGRLAELAMPRCRIVDYGDPGQLVSEAVVPPGAWLLFPEGPVTTVAPSPPPPAVIVVDATWSQARKMRQRWAPLRGLPLLHLAGKMAAQRMRASPAPGLVSTLEAIAGVVRLFDGEEAAAALERLFDLATARAHAAG